MRFVNPVKPLDPNVMSIPPENSKTSKEIIPVKRTPEAIKL